MLLVIDVGNTNIVFAVHRYGAFLPFWRLETSIKRSEDEYRDFLLPLLSNLEEEVSAVIVSSVVPSVNEGLAQFCRANLGCEAVFAGIENVGIDVDLDRPEEAGADRLVNAVAVRAEYQVPAIVIDFGTATTFDVIDEAGVYRGGAIAPGVNLSIEVLHRAAAQLPNVRVAKPQGAIGTNTEAAIQSGAYYGYLGLIEGIIARIAQELGCPPYVIATGGLAHLFAGGTDMIDHVDDMLTLKGLLYLHKTM